MFTSNKLVKSSMTMLKTCFINCSREKIKLGKEVIITWPDKIKYNGIVHKITKHYITIWYKDDIDESEYGSITNHPIKYLRFHKVRKRKKLKKPKKRKINKPSPEKKSEEEPVKRNVCLFDENYSTDKAVELLLRLKNTNYAYQKEINNVTELLFGLFN